MSSQWRIDVGLLEGSGIAHTGPLVEFGSGQHVNVPPDR